MSYRHFGAKERHTLMYLLHWRLSYRDIGCCLGCHHTNISHKVKRNGRLMACYRDEFAQERAMARHKKPRHTRRRSHKKRLHYVIERLQEDWSPETMAEHLKLDHSRSACLRISPGGV